MIGIGVLPNVPQRPDAAIQQPERQRRFLAAFAASGSILRASRAAGIHRQTHYWWMREDPTYMQRFRQAEYQAVRMLEDEAVRRAVDGVRKPIFYKGKPIRICGEIVYETEYSDALLIQLLKAYHPEKFGDKPQVQVWNGDLDSLTDQQLEKVLAQLQAMLPANKQANGAITRQLTAGEPVIDIRAENGDAADGNNWGQNTR
jgi:hypothetical protein